MAGQPTHEVFNQSSELADVDAFAGRRPPAAGRRPLQEALRALAALLRRQAREGVFAAFCAARIDAGSDVFGLLPPGCDVDLLLERARP